MIKDLEKSNLGPYPEYGIARIPDLEQVPLHWEVRCLGQVGTLAKGIGGNKDDERPEGFPCVRYGDLYTTHRFFIEETRSFISQEDSIKYTELKLGDVLFAASGETTEEIGKSAANLIDGPAYCGGDIILFRPTADLHPRYCGYVFDCQPMAVQKAIMGRGFTVHHIYGRQLKYLRFALPPPEEQAAIVRFLDHADEQIQRYIASKERLIALLEEERQALVHQAVTRGLDPSVRFKPSGVEWLGDVPEHWEVIKVQQLAAEGSKTFTDGDWIESPYITSKGVRLIQTGNVGVGRFIEKGYRYITDATFQELSCTEVTPGNILVCRLGEPVARACLAPDLNTRMITSVDVCIIKANYRVNAQFAIFVMESPKYLSWVSSLVRGSTRDRVSRSMLSKFRVPLPPLCEQTEIVNRLDKVTGAIQTNISKARRQINLMNEYRTRLIADVVTGQLDVREAKAQLPGDVLGRTNPGS